jgi:hypothetical protein
LAEQAGGEQDDPGEAGDDHAALEEASGVEYRAQPGQAGSPAKPRARTKHAPATPIRRGPQVEPVPVGRARPSPAAKTSRAAAAARMAMVLTQPKGPRLSWLTACRQWR